jgi:hypothetical protein
VANFIALYDSRVIVTFNLKDFPGKTLKEFGIEAQHPDDFLMHLLDLAPEIVCGAAHRQRINLKKPPMSAGEYLECLKRQALPKTVGELNKFINEI